jgi:hypothetical protein
MILYGGTYLSLVAFDRWNGNYVEHLTKSVLGTSGFFLVLWAVNGGGKVYH